MKIKQRSLTRPKDLVERGLPVAVHVRLSLRGESSLVDLRRSDGVTGVSEDGTQVERLQKGEGPRGRDSNRTLSRSLCAVPSVGTNFVQIPQILEIVIIPSTKKNLAVFPLSRANDGFRAVLWCVSMRRSLNEGFW